jgi:hypothetical protein
MSIGNLIDKEYAWVLIIKSGIVKTESKLMEIGNKSALWNLVSTEIKKLGNLQKITLTEEKQPETNIIADGCWGCLINLVFFGGLFGILILVLIFFAKLANPTKDTPSPKPNKPSLVQVKKQVRVSTKLQKAKMANCSKNCK